jgi:hypothetical protein
MKITEDSKQDFSIGWDMAGYAALGSRITKCQKRMSVLFAPKVESIVYMDHDGELLWDENVEYNRSGVLAVPLPQSLDEWERKSLCWNSV